MTAAPAQPSDALVTPGLLRRLAAFVYEGVLLVGIVMIAGLLYSPLTQQRSALQGHSGLQAFLFVVLATYFVWFWSHGGQTVAMKAWRVRVVTHDGRPVGPLRALLRYLACWIWFVPALAVAWMAGLHSAGQILGAVAAGIAAYALLALVHPQRQFWHDALCGTRLVSCQDASRRAQSGA
jgi:uncharacterized RDD family membrane protein YckC